MIDDPVQKLALIAFESEGEERVINLYYLWKELEPIALIISREQKILGAFEKDKFVDALEQATYKAMVKYDPSKGTFFNYIQRAWKIWAVSDALRTAKPTESLSGWNHDDTGKRELVDESEPFVIDEKPVETALSNIGVSASIEDMISLWTTPNGCPFNRRNLLRDVADGKSFPGIPDLPSTESLCVYSQRRFWRILGRE